MTRMTSAFFFAAIALLLSACSSISARPDRNQPPTLYSPNGEPLSGGVLGHPSCADAISGWFKRINVKNDGMIGEADFMADTRAQFKRMDLDHDGYITAAELSVFREPYQDVPPKDEPRDRRKERAAITHLRDSADPVMSADRNLNFRVTEDDLLTQAHVVFSALDSGHKGYLTPSDAQTMCRNIGNGR